MIIIDTREPSSIARIVNNKVIRGLHKIPNDELVIERALLCGDILISLVNTLPESLAQYMVMVGQQNYQALPIDDVLPNPTEAAIKTLGQNGLLIERKTASDFLSSLSDGRLFDQAKRLSESCKFPLLVITGLFSEKDGYVYADGRSTKWHWWAVQMALLRVQMAGVAILQFNDKYLPELVCQLWRYILDGNKPFRKAAPMRLIPLSDEAEFLCGIPNVGPEKAQALLDYTGSITSALHFLTNRDSVSAEKRPFGFGIQTITRARKFFRLKKDEVLLPTEDTHIVASNEEFEES